jgi:WD40 repeat protein
MDERFEGEVRLALAEQLFPAHGEHPAWAASPAAATVASKAGKEAGDVRRRHVAWRARTWWSALVPPADRSLAFRLAWLIALVGLLLAATVSVVYVGSQLLRRADELADVQPTVTLTLTQPGQMTEVAWSPDGTHLATGSYSQGSDADSPLLRHTVRVWDASSGEVVVALEQEDPLSQRTRIAYSPDGALLVVGSDHVSDDVNIYDPTTGEGLPDKSEWMRSASWDPLGFLAYSPDGARIAVHGYYVGPAILDATTGEIELEFPANVSGVTGTYSSVLDAAWSPDGTRLAIAYGASVRVWAATTGELLLTLADDVSNHVDVSGYEVGDNDVRDIEWSPDGTRIATVDPNRATLWNAVSGERLLTIDQPPTTPLAWDLGGHTAVSWSPDGTRFVTAGADGVATIWDAATGASVASLTGSRRDVTDVEWSPDGARIATASLDGTARIWQVPTAAEEQPTPSVPPTEDLWALEPVGEPIVSDTALGTITWRVYRGDPGSPVTVGLPADVGTPYGPVGIGYELGWLGPDGTVERTALPEAMLSLAPVGDGLIAYGTPQGYGQDQAWPISWDGSRWVVGDELDVPPFLEGQRVAAGPSGVLIVGIDAAVAPDGQHFVRVPKEPGEGDQIGPVFATADGFIALVSPGRPFVLTSDPQAFEPVPWFSADGLTWERVASSSPFGERSWVRDIAGRDGRFVAVGNVGNVYGNTGGVNGPWAVWVSDDGRTWERLVDLELGQDQVCTRNSGDCPIRVEAGEAGWVISTGKHQSLWASADGRTWERLALPAAISIEEPWGFPPVVAFGGDTIVVNGSDGLASAVGTIAP